MSRQARIKSTTKMYHTVQSGLQDKPIFKSNNDKNKLLEIIDGRKMNLDFELLGYTILDDHFHLIIKECEIELPRIMQCVQVRYAKYYNTTYGTSGPVFKDRYQSEPIEDVSELKSVVRFVNYIPLKKGIVKNMDYDWSSYNEYINDEKHCNTRILLDSFSAINEKAKKEYIDYNNIVNQDKYIEMKVDTNVYKSIKGTLEAERFINSYLDKYNIKLDDLKRPVFKSHRNTLVIYLKTNSTLSIRNISTLLDIGRSIVERAK